MTAGVRPTSTAHAGDPGARRRIEASLSFAYDERGHLSRIYLMRNPDKPAAPDAPALR